LFSASEENDSHHNETSEQSNTTTNTSTGKRYLDLHNRMTYLVYRIFIGFIPDVDALESDPVYHDNPFFPPPSTMDQSLLCLQEQYPDMDSSVNKGIFFVNSKDN
jgi:hypothetical protein